MVFGKFKSKKLRRIKVKTPKGRVVTHLRQKLKGPTLCAITGEKLRGIKRGTKTSFKNLNKSQKRVSRAFGGYMSHIALKAKILKEQVLKK